jgi:hypothetical protein
MSKAKKMIEDANRNRAIIYWHIYTTLRDELGEDRATELMKKAIYKRGLDNAKTFPKKAYEGDLNALAEKFLDRMDKELDVFSRDVLSVGEDEARLRLNACVLVDAWRDYGLSDEEISKMCDIASAIDYGNYEAMGYNLKFDSRIADGDECCTLHLRRKK